MLCGRGRLSVRARALCLCGLFLLCSMSFMGALLERRRLGGPGSAAVGLARGSGARVGTRSAARSGRYAAALAPPQEPPRPPVTLPPPPQQQQQQQQQQQTLAASPSPSPPPQPQQALQQPAALQPSLPPPPPPPLSLADSPLPAPAAGGGAPCAAPVWPRYLRVTNAPVGGFLHINEVEAFDANGTNVALGRACTASSVFDDCGGVRTNGCGCRNVVDGVLTRPNVDGVFHSFGDGPGEYVQVDLGAPTAFARVVIHNRNDAAWERLAQQTVLALDEERRVLWSSALAGVQAPQEFTLGPEVACPSATASATASASEGAPPSASPLPPPTASASESVARSVSPSPWSSAQYTAVHAAAHAAAWRGRTWPVMAEPRVGDDGDECEAACTSALACAAAANASLARAAGAAGARGALYLWAFTSAHVPLAYNLLESAFYYAPDALHGVLVAALSPGVIAAVRAYNAVARVRGAPCVFVFDASAHVTDPTVRAAADVHRPESFDSTFIAAGWARPTILLELVTAGFSILSMDVDMVLFQDLRAAWPAPERDTVSTACDGLHEPGDYNTGAMLLTREHHLHVLRLWLNSCIGPCRIQQVEQGAFQKVRPPFKRMCISPTILNHIFLRRPPDPLTNAAFHFIGNNDGKAAGMASIGLWFLPCESSTAVRGGGEATWRACLPLARPSDRARR